jgi:hypothetical protein
VARGDRIERLLKEARDRGVAAPDASKASSEDE